VAQAPFIALREEKPMRASRTLLPLILLALALLAACSTSSTSSTSGGGNSNTPAAGGTNTPAGATATATKAPITNLSDYCNLVSLAEVSQATGLSITMVTPIADSARQEVICGYAASVANSTGAVITYLVPSSAGQAQTIFSGLKQQAQSRGATVNVVAGIGDMAFSTQQSGVASIVAIKGSVVFLVGGTTAHSLPLALDTTLAQLVASKL
jgi:hypothetical protein